MSSFYLNSQPFASNYKDKTITYVRQCLFYFIRSDQIPLILFNIELIPMEDKKVLGQFHAKISKAKILYDTTSATNQKLRREAAQLQKQYESLKNNRINTEVWEKDAHDRMEHMKNMNKEQNDKCHRQTRQLNELKSNKRDNEREKIYCEAELQRCNLQLEQLIKNREELEATAKALTEKLNSTVAQKNVLHEEYLKTMSAIDKYNKNINSLQNEIEHARQVITTNTVPVHNIYDEQQRNSRQRSPQA